MCVCVGGGGDGRMQLRQQYQRPQSSINSTASKCLVELVILLYT